MTRKGKDSKLHGEHIDDAHAGIPYTYREGPMDTGGGGLCFFFHFFKVCSEDGL